MPKKPMTIREARETIARGFKEDEQFRYGYQANIAMLLYDRYGITNYDERNHAANDILELIFGEASEACIRKGEKEPIPISSRFEILDL